MYFGQKDESKLEAFRRTLKGTVGSLIEGDLKKAEISRQKRDEAGVTQELDAYRSALTNATDPVTVFNATLQTTAKLNRYGTMGAQAANQVYRVADLWKGMRPEKVVPPEPLTRIEKGNLEKHGTKYGRPVTTFKGNDPVKYDWVEEGGDAAGGSGKSEEEKLKILDKQKRGLERELRRKYPTMNLHKILLNEEEVPMVGRAVEKGIDYRNGGKETETVIKEGQQDPSVLKWVNLIAQIETELQARGEEYTPADEFALSQTNKSATTTTSTKKKKIPGF